MLHFLSKLFAKFQKKQPPVLPPNKPIFNHSFTTTPATEGFNDMSDVIPELRELYQKLHSSTPTSLNMHDINLLLKYRFKRKQFTSNFFSFNSGYTDRMVFEIENINVLYDENKQVQKLLFQFRETTFNLNMRLILDECDVEEVLSSFFLQPPQPKETA